MRGLIVIVSGVALVVATLSAQGNEKPPDAFSKAMRDNGDAVRALREAAKEFEESGAGAQDFDPFEKAAVTIRTSFATTMAYFQERNADGAVALAEQALKHVTALQAGAQERDYRVVLDALTSLNETCASCHSAHRVRTEEGGYEIKLQ